METLSPQHLEFINYAIASLAVLASLGLTTKLFNNETIDLKLISKPTNQPEVKTNTNSWDNLISETKIDPNNFPKNTDPNRFDINYDETPFEDRVSKPLNFPKQLLFD